MSRPIALEDGIITVFRDGQVTLRENRRITGFTNAIEEYGYQGLRKGDLVFHAMDAFAGAVGVSDSDGKATAEYLVYTPINKHETHVPFYGLLLRQMALSGFVLALGKSVRERSPRFKHTKFVSLELPVPPLFEQKTIAHYLDTKTAQIDRKIDLLTQKSTLYSSLKQSLINETVTRGLDKTVPMKDSGIDAIDEVPEHWEVRRIKEIAYINKRTLTEKTPNDYEFDYIDIGSITYGIKGFSSERMTFEDAPSRAKRIVKKGDTIISTVRTYLKAIASIENDVSDLIVSTGFAVISPKKLLFSKYFSYLLTSNFVVDTICALSIGVSYPATNSSVIGNLLCLVPPPSEQKAIADYLDTKTAQIDQIIQTINTQIEKLKELRRTLINDVVTGKIKVVENEHWCSHFWISDRATQAERIRAMPRAAFSPISLILLPITLSSTLPRKISWRISTFRFSVAP